MMGGLMGTMAQGTSFLRLLSSCHHHNADEQPDGCRPLCGCKNIVVWVQPALAPAYIARPPEALRAAHVLNCVAQLQAWRSAPAAPSRTAAWTQHLAP